MLKKKFCKDRIVVDIQDKDKINECILTLANVFSKHYMKTLSTMESKKSLILSEFLARLEQDYENIVKKIWLRVQLKLSLKKIRKHFYSRH